MGYRGHNIQVEVHPDLKGLTFHATYTIRRGRDTVATGTVAGELKDSFDAESSAYAAACRWIEMSKSSVD